MSNIKELKKKWREIGSSPVYFIGNSDYIEPVSTDISNLSEKQQRCVEFFEKLADILKDEYICVGSCNQDFSRYLCKSGTEDEISYKGKPDISFRMSDHWNWYANLKKCPKENYIQCYSVDAPWPRKRNGYGKASEPWKFCQVCVFVNGKYRAVFGECSNHENGEKYWLETDPNSIVTAIKNGTINTMFA